MKKKTRYFACRLIEALPVSTLVLAFFAGAPWSKAQTALAPSQAAYNANNQSAETPSGSTLPSPRLGAPDALLQWGPINGHLSLNYRLVGTDGLQSAPGKTEKTYIQTFSPGASFEIGRHWSLLYAPSWSYYSNDKFGDTVEHTASLNGQTVYEDWSLQFAQSYSLSIQPLIETGRQTRSENYATAANVVYRIGSGYSLETNLQHQLRYAEDYNDTREWSVQEWCHFRFSPELDTAVGGGPGYIEINRAPDYYVWHLTTKLDYELGKKMSVHADAGIDRRKSRAKLSEWDNNFIASLSTHYQALETTGINLGVSRSVNVPYTTRRTSISEEVSLGLDQKLQGDFRLSLAGSLGKTKYQSDIATLEMERSDNTRAFDARLSTVLFRRVTAAVFFHYTRNSSNDSLFVFTSRQAGLDLGIRF